MNDDMDRTKSVPPEGGGERIIEPEDALSPVALDDLPQEMREAVQRGGWSELMPVQSRAIPYIMAERDMMIQSRTGSGKTGAFVLPMLQRIDVARASCQALILVPTRELARQVEQEARMLSGAGGIRTVAVYGGVSYGPQMEAFQAGAQLVVGTPGRILDHLLKGSFSLDDLEMLVFDEADRMMSMGFYPDMKRVQRYLPRHPFSAYMFSATFPPYVLRLAEEFLRQPGFLSLSRDQVHVTDMEHIYYPVPAMQKDRVLVRLIEIENPASAIVFCNTKASVHYVTVVLQRFGYDADELTSDLAQGAREKVMARVRRGELRFLVATDVAARGIDIPDLSHVFIYEIPEDPENYIHRAGRTGRAGASGTAISLAAGMEEVEILSIAKRFGIPLQERPVPEDTDVQNIVSQRMVALLEAELRTRDRLMNERMQRFVPLGRSLARNEDETSLIAMLLDDYYQKSLHAALPRPEEEAAAQPRPQPSGEGRRHRPRRRR